MSGFFTCQSILYDTGSEYFLLLISFGRNPHDGIRRNAVANQMAINSTLRLPDSRHYSYAGKLGIQQEMCDPNVKPPEAPVVKLDFVST